jgi:hypothetical protein
MEIITGFNYTGNPCPQANGREPRWLGYVQNGALIVAAVCCVLAIGMAKGIVG